MPNYPQPATCVLHEDRLKKIEIGIASIDGKLDELTSIDGPLGLVRDRVTVVEGKVESLHTRVDTVEGLINANTKAINAILVKVSAAAASLSLIIALAFNTFLK